MKKYLGILIALSILGITPLVNACHLKKETPHKEKSANIEVVPTMNTQIANDNAIWVGTFQIVWNELTDNILHQAVEFIGGTNKTAQNLNKKEFSKNDISENSYYTKYGIISPDLKKEIEKGIKDKFDETSDILGSIDFTYNPRKLLIYAMLKKDFKFPEAFDKLKDEKFGTLSDTKVKYFGINSDSNYKLYKNVTVLFHNSGDDYAVKLHTKTDDEVIVYRTDEVKNLNEYFEDIKTKSSKYNGDKYFGENDRLKIPDISLYQMVTFADLNGKRIKNKDLQIDQTLETIDFKMDNEGVKLKSEAAILMKCTSAFPAKPVQIRYFYFNKDFVLFLIEKNKKVPYFAMRVTDIEALNKTGKK